MSDDPEESSTPCPPGSENGNNNNNGITLGIEGGGTRTSILLVDAQDRELDHFSAGPANLRLTKSSDLESHFLAIRNKLSTQPGTIGVGLAGVRLPSDHVRLRKAISRVWPGVPCATSDDLMTALGAIEWLDDCDIQVLLLSGTGSCSYGRRRDGTEVKLGGRGHILGDRASAIDIAQHALRALMTISDIEGKWPQLGGDILAQLQMNDPEDLIDWSMVAKKNELANVAVAVFRAARERNDKIAIAVLNKAAERLSKDALACAERIAQPGDKVQFVLNGGVLLKNPQFTSDVTTRLTSGFENAVVTPLKRPSVWGAVTLARENSTRTEYEPIADNQEKDFLAKTPEERHDSLWQNWRPVSSSPTEQRHPRSMHFSELSTAEGIALMLEEDANIPRAIQAESKAIEWTVERVVRAFAEGGRLIYAGAGTSGRLGVLDASECPPTFRVSPIMVQAIMAGGRSALWSAVEGAEDDPAAGARAVRHRHVTEQDVVVGISASGYAPFIWGCLEEAKQRGAATVLLSCNPAYRDHPIPDCAITPDTGPELLTGSTRLRAGTATKLVLNLITTLAMTHSGKVLSNLMVDLNPSNAKLRDRAVRIVQEIASVSAKEARKALEQSSWIVRQACELLKNH